MDQHVPEVFPIFDRLRQNKEFCGRGTPFFVNPNLEELNEKMNFEQHILLI